MNENIFNQINEDIKSAMLERDKVKLESLRGAKKEFLEAKTAKGGDGTLSDEKAIQIIQKMIKQRKDAADIFQTQNREELAENELAEAAILENYLPAQMSVEELTAYITATVKKLGANGMQDMGKIMGVASKELAGRSDGKSISNVVRQVLSNL